MMIDFPYSVTVPLSSRLSSITKIMENTDDILEFCATREWNYRRDLTTSLETFYFVDANDAILFKLKFG